MLKYADSLIALCLYTIVKYKRNLDALYQYFQDKNILHKLHVIHVVLFSVAIACHKLYNITLCTPTHILSFAHFSGSFVLLLWIFYVFVLSCVCYVLCASVYMCFVVTCWERADLLALVCGVFCEFVTFPLVSWVRCGT